MPRLQHGITAGPQASRRDILIAYIAETGLEKAVKSINQDRIGALDGGPGTSSRRKLRLFE